MRWETCFSTYVERNILLTKVRLPVVKGLRCKLLEKWYQICYDTRRGCCYSDKTKEQLTTRATSSTEARLVQSRRWTIVHSTWKHSFIVEPPFCREWKGWFELRRSITSSRSFVSFQFYLSFLVGPGPQRSRVSFRVV